MFACQFRIALFDGHARSSRFDFARRRLCWSGRACEAKCAAENHLFATSRLRSSITVCLMEMCDRTWTKGGGTRPERRGCETLHATSDNVRYVMLIQKMLGFFGAKRPPTPRLRSSTRCRTHASDASEPQSRLSGWCQAQACS